MRGCSCECRRKKGCNVYLRNERIPGDTYGPCCDFLGKRAPYGTNPLINFSFIFMKTRTLQLGLCKHRGSVAMQFSIAGQLNIHWEIICTQQVTSRDSSEEKRAEQATMTKDARKVKMEERRAKMVRRPS
jgi:hypothetical protein